MQAQLYFPAGHFYPTLGMTAALILSVVGTNIIVLTIADGGSVGVIHDALEPELVGAAEPSSRTYGDQYMGAPLPVGMACSSKDGKSTSAVAAGTSMR